MSEEENKSLIKVKDALGLEKPATMLIKKVSDGVGGLYEPYGTVRQAKADAEAAKIKAKADAEAAKIKAKADIKINELRERAYIRAECQNIRTQRNIEQITEQAIKVLPLNTSEEDVQKMGDDWIANLFKHCDTVSDKEMQLLWGKILAGEAAKSGSFSKRTVACVSQMDKKDARMFTDFCQFVWGGFQPLIYAIKDPVYNKGETRMFNMLEHLSTIGLVIYDESDNYYSTVSFSQVNCFYYHNIRVHIDISGQIDKEGKYLIMRGHANLTQVGMELYPICGAQKNEEFLQYMFAYWKKSGYNPSLIPYTPK